MSSSGRTTQPSILYYVGAATGVAATDTANWTSAINKANLSSTGAIVQANSGTYQINAPLPTITSPSVSIAGEGSGATTLNFTGSGDCFRIQESSFNVGVQGGELRGLTVLGNSSANSNGVHIGDIIGFGFYDVVVRNFTGAASSGILFENATNWTERTTLIRTTIDNCTNSFRFIMSGSGAQSFGYTRFLDCRLNINTNQVGFQLENSASLYSSEIVVMANMFGTGAKLFNYTGTSRTDHGHFSVRAEGGTNPVRFAVAAGATVLGVGTVQFAGAAPAYTDSILGTFTLADQVSNAVGRTLRAWDGDNDRGQLVYGDTGWRDVSASIVNSWTTTGLLLRRVGNTVYCAAGSISGTAATANKFLGLPAGFTWDKFTAIVVAGDGGTTTFAAINIDNTSSLSTASRAASLYFMLSWPTDDAWPTVLPGTATGSIPS